MKEIKKKIFGFLGGFLLIVLGIILLWFNEGRTAKTESTIKEATKEYIEISSDVINEKYENKLIATTGTINLNNQEVTDPIFKISIPSAKLYRKVEIYQWEETCENNEDNTKTCHYGKVWSEELIDSTKFVNTSFSNPTEMKYQSETFYNESTKVGAFTLGNTFLGKLSTKKQITNLNQEIASTLGLTVDDDNTYIDSNIATGGMHSIGNIRISFYYNDATTISIMATQSNNTFKAYTSKTGYKIEYLSESKKTAPEILTDLTEQNNLFKWILRLLGIILIVSGFGAIASPLQTLTSFIPLFGGIVRWVFGWLASFIGLSVSFVVIALAWLRYRPILSFVLILIALVIIILCCLIIRKNKKKTIEKEKENTPPQQKTQLPQESELSKLYSNQVKDPANPYHNHHQIDQNITIGRARNQQINSEEKQRKINAPQTSLQDFYKNNSKK